MLDCRIEIAGSNLGPKGPCKKCMYVAQLVRVCSWRLATSGTFGSDFKCGRATYINYLGQGTNIQLPLLSGVSVLPKKKKK